MATIDERIVSMVFENAKFEAGVAQTMASLSKLDASLGKVGANSGASFADIDKAASKVTLQQPMSALDKLRARLGGAGQGAAEGMGQIESAGNKVTLDGPINALDKVQSRVGTVGANASQGFSEIEAASNRVSLQGLNSALDSVTAKFSVLSGAASVAMGNLASQATTKGMSFAKSFAFGPVMQGLDEYKTNLGSIQTILANTEGQQVSGLGNVNKYLGELNKYSDQTIYNFSQMAKNIGTFTAAGVALPEATSSIKGIANLAALSGSSSQQASTAMYQLSQAIAAGRVSLQDWNSVVNAGMGGAKFQQALMRTAENMGALEDGAVKIDKATGKATVNGQSFRESIMAKPGETSWLSSEVLTGTLQQFTGDLSDAELAAQGFTAEQIKAIQSTAKTARAAATEVKTLPQAFEVARETIGSGWAKTFQNVFGDFNESKKTFTEFSNTLNGYINQVSDARNKVLGDWKKLGGRTVLIEGIKDAFHALATIINVVSQAFRSVFPRKTGQDLYDMTQGFANLAKRLQPTYGTIQALRRTFAGFFAVLHIGWSIVKGVIGVFGELLGTVSKGSGGFLNFTGSIGDLLVAIDNALTKGGLLTSFFDGIASALKVPLQLLMGVTSAIFGLFGGVSSGSGDKVAGSMGAVTSAAGPLGTALDTLKQAWAGMVEMFRQAKDLVSPWLDNIGDQLSGFAEKISEAFSGGNFENVLAVLQTGFLAGIFALFKKTFDKLTGNVENTLGGLNNVLGGLTKNMEVMQNKIKSEIIRNIAIAIGILAAAIFVLSKVDAEDLGKSLTAITIGLGQLAAVMRIMGGLMSGAGAIGMIVGMPVLAASMILLATSLVVLAAAAKIFASMSWEELAKGLAGIGGGLAAIGLGMKFLGPGTIIQGPAILVLAIALNALALAVKQFASISWEDLSRGLIGVFGSLVALVIPLAATGPGLVVAGAGLVAISFAMNLLAGAVASFAAIDPEKMFVGIAGMTAALLLLGVAVLPLGPMLPITAAGLILMGVALSGIASAIALMGNIGIEAMIKGLAGLAGALAILAIGVTAMSLSAGGAAALMATALALAVLAPTIAFMGTLNWGTILKGLVALSGLLAVIAVGGTLAAPSISALGMALFPLAGVFVLTAGAVFIFAKALALLGDNGAKGIGVMVTAVTAFVALLPKIIIDFVKGIVEIVAELAKIAPKVIASIVKILNSMIEVVIRSTPRLAFAIGILVNGILAVIMQNSPKLIAAGWQLILNLLKGIDQNLPQVMTRVGNIIVKFIEGLTSQAPRIIAAGGNFLIVWLSGITGQIPKLVTAGIRMVTTFLSAIATRIGSVVSAGVRLVTSFLRGIGENIGRLYAAGTRVILQLMDGIGKSIPRLISKGVEVAGKFVRAVARGLVKLVNVAFDAMIDFLNGLAQAIRDNDKELIDAGANIMDAIIDGVVEAAGRLAGPLRKAIQKLFGMLPGWARSVLGIKSPSTVFAKIGELTMAGFAQGIHRGSGAPVQAVTRTANTLVDATNEALSKVSSLKGIADVDPVISPVLDLTGVTKEAKKLDGLTDVTPITPLVSLGQAAAISAEKAALDAATVEAATPVVKEIKFEQHNTSPEALSAVEIYRQTHNLFSLAQGEAGLTAA